MAIQPGEPMHPFSLIGVSVFAPSTSGVYALCDARGNYIYFGESKDMRRRLGEHVANPDSDIVRAGAAYFACEEIQGELARVLRQNELIGLYPTPCNQRLY